MAFDPSLRPGLASFTPHFSEEVDVNVLTNDAWDPKSGTSEFKATAVRIEKLAASCLPGPGSSAWICACRERQAARAEERGRRGVLAARLGTGDAAGRRSTSPTPGTPRAAGATCCCRRCTRCRTRSAGSARARSTTSRAGSRCRPPTSTGWRRSTRCSPASRARRAWCTCATTSSAARRGGEEIGAGSGSWDRGARTDAGRAARAWACASGRPRCCTSALGEPDVSRAGQAGRRDRRAGRGRRAGRRRRGPPTAFADPTVSAPQARRRPRRPAAAGPRRRRRPGEPRRLPRPRRLHGAAPGGRARPDPGDQRRYRRVAHRPRRRRVPHRRKWDGVARPRSGRTTSCATPTSPSPARSRTGCSWRATRSPWSRP